jgi:rhamnulokinase
MAQRERNFVAFDLGAESGRAILGTLADGRLVLEEKHRFANPSSRVLGHLHWNLLAQWEELKTGLRIAAAGGLPIDGIGVDTWGVDFGLLGPNGQLLGMPYCYRDSRTDGVMERTFRRIGREKLYELTGLQFMQFNSLFQLIAAQEQEPAVLEFAETMLFVPDLFNYLFTGVRKAEYSIASTSQMLDPHTGKWAVGMIKQLGLPTKVLPEVVASGTVLGPLTSDVQKECNVGPVPVIAPACHDTGSAVAAVPVSEGSGNWCYISSGTWSLMGVELDKPIINEKSLRYNYTNEGGVGGSIRFLKNIMGLWLVQECRRQFKRDGADHTYGELTQMAERCRPCVSVIDPDHAPFLSPGEMPRKIEEFCRRTGQPVPGTRGEFVRTCLDSLALTYRRTLEGLEDILGKRIDTVHIVGGGTQNQLLNQMTADACNRPVVTGPVEATAIGNLLVQAMAVGDIKSLAEAREVVRNSFEVKRYEPRETKVWDEAYGRYRDVQGK